MDVTKFTATIEESMTIEMTIDAAPGKVSIRIHNPSDPMNMWELEGETAVIEEMIRRLQKACAAANLMRLEEKGN